MLLLTESPELENLLSAKKLARRLRVSPRTIYRRVERGELPAPRRVGPKQVGWLWDDVMAWNNRTKDRT